MQLDNPSADPNAPIVKYNSVGEWGAKTKAEVSSQCVPYHRASLGSS